MRDISCALWELVSLIYKQVSLIYKQVLVVFGRVFWSSGRRSGYFVDGHEGDEGADKFSFASPCCGQTTQPLYGFAEPVFIVPCSLILLTGAGVDLFCECTQLSTCLQKWGGSPSFFANTSRNSEGNSVAADTVTFVHLVGLRPHTLQQLLPSVIRCTLPSSLQHRKPQKSKEQFSSPETATTRINKEK